MTGLENRSERAVPFAVTESLTPRERECLLLVAEHLRSKQIARKLGLSPLTVDKYIASACERLGVSSRHEAAVLVTGARQEGASPTLAVDAAMHSDAPSLFGRLLARTRRIGERLDEWETRRRSWVRTAGQVASLYAIFNILKVVSRRTLFLLSEILPPDLFSKDFLPHQLGAHSAPLGAVVIGTYWDVVSTFTLITLMLALWRGRLPVVVVGASIVVGSLICEGVETRLSGPVVVHLVTLNDLIHTILLAAFWTIYPRRWLALCIGFEALMVAADFNVPSQPSMNGQLWIISQAYLTVFTMLTLAVTAGAWPWAGARFLRLRDWLGGDLVRAAR